MLQALDTQGNPININKDIKIQWNQEGKLSDHIINVDSGHITTIVGNAFFFRTTPETRLPIQATPGSVGYDLCSIDEGILYPGDTKVFSTGLIVKPPEGYYIEICARSGWGKKYGVGIPHGVGIIDADYCGPQDVLGVVLHRACTSGGLDKDYTSPLKISKGDRIAQMIFKAIHTVEFTELLQPPSESSRGGFGSSGIK